MTPIRTILSYFAHGPLLAWIGIVAASTVFAATAMAVGSDVAGTDRDIFDTPAAVTTHDWWDIVRDLKADLEPLTVLTSASNLDAAAAYGDGLARQTLRYSTDAAADGRAELSAGFADASNQATRLSEAARSGDTPAVIAASFSLGVIADQLTSVSLGGDYPDIDWPERIPLGLVGEGGNFSGLDGTGVGTGAGTPSNPGGAVNGP